MALTPKKLISCLRSKLEFEDDEARSVDHRYFKLEVPGIQTVRTKVGHHTDDIGPVLESKIAKQLRVPVIFLRDMVACLHGRYEYLELLRRDPPPPPPPPP
jgi:hypothetical protein